MTLLIISCLLLFFLVLGGSIYYSKKIGNLKEQILTLEINHIEEVDKARKDSAYRSSNVQWGKTIENWAPYMKDFPIPPEDVNFLGMPIDYIGFTDTNNSDECTVHFIEIKSGNARLSTKQRNIKKAIEQNRVKWHEIKLEGNYIN